MIAIQKYIVNAGTQVKVKALYFRTLLIVYLRGPLLNHAVLITGARPLGGLSYERVSRIIYIYLIRAGGVPTRHACTQTHTNAKRTHTHTNEQKRKTQTQAHKRTRAQREQYGRSK